MNEFSIVHAYTATSKFWNLLGPIIHLLQSQPDDMKVRRQTIYMLTMQGPANREIVLRASITVVDDYRFAALTAQLLQCGNEFRRDQATLAVWTRQLNGTEMLAEITHGINYLPFYWRSGHQGS